FDNDRMGIKPQYQAIIEEVVNVMVNDPSLKMYVYGFTDNNASAEYNRILSKKRAEAVKAVIVSRGISKDRLTTRGFGFAMAAASNDTEEGRALNRRVEFHVMP
ncbi:MAG: OmpA family protein, partial [Deltaproteobacteria bacterium]|nr:OmpA family protein [Deltaproteobacteria bacterium]